METHSYEDEDGDDPNEECLLLTIDEKDRSKILEGKENNKKSEREKTALHAKVEPRAWIFDYGCSNHMNGDKDKFINLKKYDGGLVKFAGEEATPICGVGSISIDGKHKTNNVYYIEGMRHSLLSVS